jgi:hypothetical protein
MQFPIRIKTRMVLLIYSIVGLLITLQSVYFSGNTADSIPKSYNNYRIFKASATHLVTHQNLYQTYSAEHWDLYKYSPTFALLFLPLSYLPDFLGLLIWNLLNLLPLLAGLFLIPFFSDKNRLFALAFVFIEWMTATQNSQSNSLLVALILLAWLQLERKNMLLASLLFALTFYIKVYGVLLVAIFVFYSNRKIFLMYFLAWMSLLFVLPIVFIPFSEIILQYQNWWQVIVADQQSTWGISLMGMLHGIFGWEVNKTLIALLGLLILLPAVHLTLVSGKYKHRLALVAALLIWLIVFNFRSESPTYIVAIVGVAIWIFAPIKMDITRKVLLLLVLVGTSIITTDLVPLPDKRKWLYDYALKGLPCLLVFMKIVSDFLLEWYGLVFATKQKALDITN